MKLLLNTSKHLHATYLSVRTDTPCAYFQIKLFTIGLIMKIIKTTNARAPKAAATIPMTTALSISDDVDIVETKIHIQ